MTAAEVKAQLEQLRAEAPMVLWRKACTDAIDLIATLEADAARYRWLRENWSEPATQYMHPWDDFAPDPDQLDAQIDSARSKDQP